MLQTESVLHNRYQLKQKLGQNAGRQTWLAQDIVSEDDNPSSLVIVKLLMFGGEVQWDDLKLFEREAQILRQLNHPQIPNYRDYFSIDERILWFGLVQDYIPGHSLKDLLQEGKRFNEAEVRQIAQEILAILIYLHGLHPAVLHRDIKPSNLILGENQKIYLVDFGAVQDKAAAEGATFTVVGSYGYAPMEQFGGRAVPASDLYALGATLIHLLTGTPPADLPTENLQIQFQRLVNVSPNFLYWLEQMTEPAIERRLQTASEAIELLNSVRVIDETPNDFLPVHVVRPPETKVEIATFKNRLKVHIPSGFSRMKSMAEKAIAAVGLTVLFFINPVVFLICVFLVRELNVFLLGTEIDLTKNEFYIRRTFLKYSFWSKKGQTRLIQDISLHYQRGTWRSQARPEGITITATNSPSTRNFKRFFLAEGLTETELIWLAQEIRDWLRH